MLQNAPGCESFTKRSGDSGRSSWSVSIAVVSDGKVMSAGRASERTPRPVELSARRSSVSLAIEEVSWPTA